MIFWYIFFLKDSFETFDSDETNKINLFLFHYGCNKAPLYARGRERLEQLPCEQILQAFFYFSALVSHLLRTGENAGNLKIP